VPVAFPPKLEAIIRARLGSPSRMPAACQIEVCESEVPEVEKTASHRPRINTSLGLAPSILPASDVVRALRRYRYDREFRGHRRVPIRLLAGLVGLSHETLYEAMRRGNASELTRAKLTRAVMAVAEGRLRFRRRGQVWKIEGQHPAILEPRRRGASRERAGSDCSAAATAADRLGRCRAEAVFG
jgi:hypothetical protein